MHQLNPVKNTSRLRTMIRLCSGQTLLCKSLNLKVKDWDQKKFNAKILRIDDQFVAYCTKYHPDKCLER